MSQVNKTHIDEYLTALDSIQGWFYPEDVRLFQALNVLQGQDGVTGDLLEIGVYHGKSSILLGYFPREDEHLVVCDLFEQSARTVANQAEAQCWYSSLSRELFENNYLHFHDRLPVIVKCPSTHLMKVGKLSRTFRFIHIDGSHLYAIVKRDIRTAKALLRDSGIVAIDDYRSIHTPGVAAAAWEEIARGELIPFCLTPQKMYATWARATRQLMSRLTTWAHRSGAYDVATEKVCGRNLLRLQLKTSI